MASRIIAALTWSLLLAACGWVDSGVGGNEPPVTATADYTVIAGETLEVGPEEGVLSDDFDVGGRSLIAELVTEPQHASDFILNLDGSFRYTHVGSETTSDQFEYVASDQIDESAPTPVTLRILHRPRAVDDAAATEEGEPVRIEVLGNDTDLDNEIVPESLTIDDPPTGGSADANPDGTITYTPNAGSGGQTDTFTYRVADEAGLESNPATVTVTVQAPPPPPAPPPEPEPEPTPPPAPPPEPEPEPAPPPAPPPEPQPDPTPPPAPPPEPEPEPAPPPAPPPEPEPEPTPPPAPPPEPEPEPTPPPAPSPEPDPVPDPIAEAPDPIPDIVPPPTPEPIPDPVDDPTPAPDPLPDNDDDNGNGNGDDDGASSPEDNGDDDNGNDDGSEADGSDGDGDVASDTDSDDDNGSGSSENTDVGDNADSESENIAGDEGNATDDPDADSNDEPAPVAEDDEFEETGTGVLVVGALSGVLANDSAAATAAVTGLQIREQSSLEAVLSSAPSHGQVELAADGSFRYQAEGSPPSEGMDRFTYRARQGGSVSAPATVTIRFASGVQVCWMLPEEGVLHGRLGAEAPGKPVLYGIRETTENGELTLLDQTTGEFRYRASRSEASARSQAFHYSVSKTDAPAVHYPAEIRFTPRLMLVRTQPIPEAGTTDFRYALQKQLQATGFTVGFVDAPHAEAGSGSEIDTWTLEELTWGRAGDPHDGIRSRLDSDPADLILLQAPAEGAEFQGFVDEVARWSVDTGGAPVTIVAPTPDMPDHEDTATSVVWVESAAAADPQAWLTALEPLLADMHCPVTPAPENR